MNLDREQKSQYVLRVMAKDGDVTAPRSNSTVVYITILDANDNVPKFARSHETVHVLEDVPVGFSVANVSNCDGGGDDGGDYLVIVFVVMVIVMVP